MFCFTRILARNFFSRSSLVCGIRGNFSLMKSVPKIVRCESGIVNAEDWCNSWVSVIPLGERVSKLPRCYSRSLAYNPRDMRPTLREVLADSHIAAAAIAMLMIGSLRAATLALFFPFYRILNFLVSAIAIRDIPSAFLLPDDTPARAALIITSLYCAYAAAYVLSAWLLSRWVYGMGPLRALGACRRKLIALKYA